MTRKPNPPPKAVEPQPEIIPGMVVYIVGDEFKSKATVLKIQDGYASLQWPDSKFISHTAPDRLRIYVEAPEPVLAPLEPAREPEPPPVEKKALVVPPEPVVVPQAEPVPAVKSVPQSVDDYFS